MEVNEFLSELAPGQSGIIYQGAGNWRHATCQQVEDDAVIMLVHSGTGEGEITLDETVAFKTRCDSGLLRVEGSLTGSTNQLTEEPLHFTPTVGAEIINRRQAFRIESDISARLVGTASEETATQTRYGYKWDCELRDLSVGGVNAVLASPGPLPSSIAILTLPMPTEDEPLELECMVVEVIEAAEGAEPDTMVRLMFKGLTSQNENQLGKYINWVQLEARRNWLPL